MQGFFSYLKTDPNNIRNIADYGGGGIWDIGCYPVTTSRFVFGEEPTRVFALLEYDPEMKIDRLSSAVMEFPSGHATLTAGTQLVPFQKMQFFGTDKRIEIEVPFTIPPDRDAVLFVDPAGPLEDKVTRERIPACDQYTLQADAFSRAVLGEGQVPGTLEDALANVAALEAVYRSGRTGRPEVPQVPERQA